MSLKRNLSIILLAVGIGLGGCSKNPVSLKIEDINAQVELSPYDLSLLRIVGGPDDVRDIKLHGYPADNYLPIEDVTNLANIVKTNAKSPKWFTNDEKLYSITIGDTWEVNYFEFFENSDPVSSALMIEDLREGTDQKILIPLFDYKSNGTLNPIAHRVGDKWTYPRLPNEAKNRAYLNLVKYLTQIYQCNKR